jgi:hypothetical protein
VSVRFERSTQDTAQRRIVFADGYQGHIRTIRRQVHTRPGRTAQAGAGAVNVGDVLGEFERRVATDPVGGDVPGRGEPAAPERWWSLILPNGRPARAGL